MPQDSDVEPASGIASPTKRKPLNTEKLNEEVAIQTQ